MEIVFFNQVTTGLDSTKDKIVELSMVKIDSISNKVVEKYNKKFNSNNVTISDYTKIQLNIESEDELSQYENFSDNVDEIVDFIGDCALCCYNIKFNIPFLYNELYKAGKIINLRNREIIDPKLIYGQTIANNFEGVYKHYMNEDYTETNNDSKVDAIINLYTKQKESGLEMNKENSEIYKTYIDINGYFKPVLNEDNKTDDIIFNFGKNIGKSIFSEVEYLKWMAGSNFPSDTVQYAIKFYNFAKSNKK